MRLQRVDHRLRDHGLRRTRSRGLLGPHRQCQSQHRENKQEYFHPHQTSAHLRVYHQVPYLLVAADMSPPCPGKTHVFLYIEVAPSILRTQRAQLQPPPFTLSPSHFFPLSPSSSSRTRSTPGSAQSGEASEASFCNRCSPPPRRLQIAATSCPPGLTAPGQSLPHCSRGRLGIHSLGDECRPRTAGHRRPSNRHAQTLPLITSGQPSSGHPAARRLLASIPFTRRLHLKDPEGRSLPVHRKQRARWIEGERRHGPVQAPEQMTLPHRCLVVPNLDRPIQ